MTDRADETETMRRQMIAKQQTDGAKGQPALEEAHGQVWNGDQLRCDFEVQGFMVPFIIVRRLSDGVVGTLEFQHDPRLYWDFKEDKD